MDEVLRTAQADALVDRLHAYHRQIRRVQQETWKKYASTFPQLRIWLANLIRPGRKHLQNALDVARTAREYGAPVAAKTGVSVAMQVLQQLRLFSAYRIPADSYYFLRMYEKPMRRKARFFLGDKPTSMILRHLATTAPDEEFAPLHEKMAFWKHCRAHDLPTVPVLAAFDDGSLQHDYGGIREALPSQDLFSKPVTAFLGQGARKWTYDEKHGHFRDDTGHTYAPRAVIDALKAQSEGQPLLLQRCVHDHPRLQTLTGRAGPSTLQIVTLRKPDEPPEYFAAFLTTPFQEVSTPTFTGGTALAARVDADSGRLDRPLYKQADYLLGNRTQHPMTGTPIPGFELPYWDEARALALQAHTTLPSIACVGWDLILTADGPLLLEGNNDCSAALTQITHQRLLGLTRFPVYLDAHAQNVISISSQTLHKNTPSI